MECKINGTLSLSLSLYIYIYMYKGKVIPKYIELNRLYTTQLTVILQLVTSATCFDLVWPSSGLQRLVSIKVHNVAVPMGSHRYSNIMGSHGLYCLYVETT